MTDNLQIVTIHEPYWGAGSPKKFGWVKDGLTQAGIGIALDILNRNRYVGIKVPMVSNQTFLLNARMALEFIKKYNSLDEAKKYPHTKLGVVSVALLTELLI